MDYGKEKESGSLDGYTFSRFSQAFERRLQNLSEKDRLRVLRERNIPVIYARFRKGDRGYCLFSARVMRYKKVARIAITTPRGRHFYAWCVERPLKPILEIEKK